MRRRIGLRKLQCGMITAAVLVAWALVGGSVRADAQLHRLFSHGVVLQQERLVPIFGTAGADEEVVVTLQDYEAKTKADADGNWQVEIGPLKAGGPFPMLINGGRRAAVDVMVGEVWVCAGGTNMQWPLINSEGAGAAMVNSANQQLRLYLLKREGATEPKTDTDVPWTKAGAASVGGMSAVGYFFGRTLAKELNVPIGLISCNNYQSSIESWISKPALEASPALKKSLDKPSSALDPKSPSVLYNGMVNPITRFAVRGVIWYHGEASVESAYQYREALPVLIDDWRKQWKQPEMPFLIVQLAPHKSPVKVQGESKLAELRESQLLVAKKTPHTALVVTTDYGDPYDLHPRQKEPIGQRLALAAQAVVYGKQIEYMGPIFKSVEYGKGKAVLKFDHIGTGLMVKGDELKGFFIAGLDDVFHEAKAVIEGDTVVVSSPAVAIPRAVRYGWAEYPGGNLFNKEGLPASPFRTDNLRLLTMPPAE